MAVDASGMPLRIQVTSGTVSDCKEAGKLIEGISGNYLLADRGYDTNRVIEEANNLQFEVVIPPKRTRKNPRPFDKGKYEKRHKIENTFLKLKKWRGIATRYAKTTASYVAAVQICCMVMWLSIL
jgi:transposase